MENSDFDGSFASKAKKIFKRLVDKKGIAISSAAFDDEFYPVDAKKMGTCLIFNHKIFECGLKERKGTDKDKDALELFFGNCGFDVEVYTDKKAAEITKILKKAKNKNHENVCCFVCCVLTHGDLKYQENTEVLYATDKFYPTDDLFTPFLDCDSLVGKPKLFFIQACRGGKPTEGTDILFKFGAGSKVMAEAKQIGNETFLMCTLPKAADFLIAHSTIPGSFSWSNSDNGSWFIQELCETLNAKVEDLDLDSILTIVRRRVALNYRSKTKDDPKLDKMKQIPSLYTTLTRKFNFPSIDRNCSSEKSSNDS